MKSIINEGQVVNLLMVGFTLFDFFTLPFNSFIITLVFALVLYGVTKSQVMLVSVLTIPQLIRFVNSIMNGKKESFMPTNAQEVVENVRKMKEKKESFVDLKEVSDRVIKMKEVPQAKVEQISGLVDKDAVMPSLDSISFLEQFENRTNLNENVRINTIPESAVPAVGTMENNTRPVSTVEPFDDQSLNTALVRSMNNMKPTSSNIESIEMNRQ